MAIPRKIFQTARSYEGLHQDYKDNIEKLKRLNPGWDYQFFDDVQMKSYIRDHVTPGEWALLQEVNPKYGVVFADVFRYLVIFNEGGVYLDIKSTADRPLDDVLPPQAKYIISQWPNKIGQKYQNMGFFPDIYHVPGGEFQQWHVISERHHPFLKAVCDRVFRNLRDYTPRSFGTDAVGVIRLTGPIAYTLAIHPLMQLCDYTALEIDSLGIHYSIYEAEGDTHRHQRDPGHYRLVREPIVLRDVYVEPPMLVTQSLGELIANEMRDNVDLVLKLAVFAVLSTATVLVLLPLILLWLLR